MMTHNDYFLVLDIYIYMYFVYQITNIVNGMIYVGKTVNVKARFARHKKIAKAGPNGTKGYFSYLHQGIEKYGPDNFVVETISMHQTEDEAFTKESDVIRLHLENSQLLYNLSTGGKGGCTGVKKGPMPLSTRQKLSQINKGQKNPKGPEHWSYGKAFSIAHRKKLSEHNRNNILSEQDLLSIRTHLKDGKLLQREIASLFHVDPSVISRINTGANHIL